MTSPSSTSVDAIRSSAVRVDEFTLTATDDVVAGREVLDACCGSRMMIVVDPDILGTYAALPFDDASFSLVVFDPPHTFNGTNGAMAMKYGTLEPGWREEITKGFAECFRVLKPSGTLIFKWNEHRVPLATVLAMTPEKPLFGHRSGALAKTHWVVWIKSAGV